MISILLLCNIVDVKYRMEMVLTFVKVSYSSAFFICKVVLSMSNDCIWVEPLTLTNIRMNRKSFHPLFLMS